MEKIVNTISLILCHTILFATNPGILNVGFDIDDTVLYSKDIFSSIPDGKRNPIDYNWVNLQDKKLSRLIGPTIELIEYFNSNGHNIFFITARSSKNGESLANFLSECLDIRIVINENLFFCPKEYISGTYYTTKHRTMKKLQLDLFYGDADSDIIAALKAGVHPIRIVRYSDSINQYGQNYFGNILDGETKKNPFGADELKIFYSKGVGLFGESIYPIIWEGP